MTTETSSSPELVKPELAEPELPEPELPELVQAVLDLVDQIPVGMVLSYGDIAELLGRGGPRQVGAILSRYGSAVAWWRVTRASGDLPRGLQGEALAHWRTEGTSLAVTAGGDSGSLVGSRVDMRLARWDGVDGSNDPGGHPDAVLRG